MYVITKSGKKLPVDDSAIDYENDYVPYYDTVGIFTDDAYLEEVWIVTVEKNNNYLHRSKDPELVIVLERLFDHEPTQEDIMLTLAGNGCEYGCIAHVTKGYRLENEFE